MGKPRLTSLAHMHTGGPCRTPLHSACVNVCAHTYEHTDHTDWCSELLSGQLRVNSFVYMDTRMHTYAEFLALLSGGLQGLPERALEVLLIFG